MQKKVRWEVFLPPWLILIAAVVLNFVNYETFVSVTTATVDWILAHFSWMFSLIALISLIMILAAYCSPFRNVRIGGSKSRPIFSYSNYIWVVLCTIMGAGLMLWACAEPLYHLYAPPENVTAGAMSGEAVLWAMETIFLEWTFTPMAIYALPAILFAFCFYNMKKPFAVSSMLVPAIGEKRSKKAALFVDILCLFCTAVGMAGTLGSGITMISSGIETMTNGAIAQNVWLWIVCGVGIITVYVISAASGLNRGIRILSKMNAYFYLAIGALVFLCGPTTYLLNLCTESFGAYLSDFFKLSLWVSASTEDGWAQSWPIFYWCMGLAWMPVSAVFLGRISRGYTVREVLNGIFLIPSLFSVIWLTLFSGSAVYYELHGAELMETIREHEMASASYAVLKEMPFSMVLIPLFLLTAFISYVTSADSNTNAIAGLCTDGLKASDSESPMWLKVVWGITIGVLSLIMLIIFNMDGMKMLATIGGFPAAVLMILFFISFWKVMHKPKAYDVFQEDYEEDGKPLITVRNPVAKPEKKEDKK